MLILADHQAKSILALHRPCADFQQQRCVIRGWKRQDCDGFSKSYVMADIILQSD